MASQTNSSSRRKRSKPAKPMLKIKKTQRREEDQKLEALEKLAQDFECPPGGTAFSVLPISEPTKRGLKKNFYENMTDIQAHSIPVSLKGRDVLGAAQTGSGKTLAFLVPALEILYRKKWGQQDGLGGLIISPTRELAIQIFHVLRRIGGYHSFSAGLVIGGKNLKDERDRLSRMNILVATPGRLLQHMDQTVGFEAHNLQILVLDEADRILDMGFARTLNAIVNHLPKSRQTLLFSATQTQSVKDLARLSLDDPVHVTAQEAGSELVTPKNLEHHYMVCELDVKLDVLYSFIRTHLKAKMIVFMSSGKQVRFVYETFCQLQPGIPILHLHGKQNQTKRLATYQRFITTSHSILFATDIAARGLDFPAVDWVVQLDAPEDAETYIHRVGRTARYESAGKGLLFILPSEEEGLLKVLNAKGVVIEKIKPKQNKITSIAQQLQNFAFKDPEIKYLGQRAFVSYMRSIYLQKDKSIFKLDELPADKFAASLGLPGTPKIKFLKKSLAAKRENGSNTAVPFSPAEESDGQESSEGEGVSEEDEGGEGKLAAAGAAPKSTNSNQVRTKYDRMFERKNQNVLSKHYAKLVDHKTDDLLAEGESDDEFITLEREDHALSNTDEEINNRTKDKGQLVNAQTARGVSLSKRKLREAFSRKASLKYKGVPKKLVFDEEGQPHELYEMHDDEVFRKRGGEVVKEEGRRFAEGERVKLLEADVRDKEEAREKKREKKRKRKQREKTEQGEGAPAAVLRPMSDEGYQSPELISPGVSSERDEEEGERRQFLKKRRRKEELQPLPDTVEEEENLALRMLRGQ